MLPDLRNLGTILRILFIVNGAALVVAFARQPRLDAMMDEWIGLTGFVEPYLLATLALLALAARRLVRLPYRMAVGAIVLVTCVVGIALHAAFARLLPGEAGSLPRQLAYALGAVALLLYYFHLRIKALSPAITEARLQALQARIRPHFLFNSINAVLSLIRREPQRAEAALEDMAELFRVLMRDNRELTPLEHEVTLCRQYLDLEKLRLGERLVVDWNVKSMPADALVPPLVLQPLLENAVYHGIEPASTPGTVSVNLFLSRGEVHAILKNPIPANGRRHQSGNKMALENVRERLALHFDAEASLESRVAKDVYEVHIRMPYRTVMPAQAAPAPVVEARAGGRDERGARKARVAAALVAGMTQPGVARG